MQLDLSENQTMIRDLVRRFSQERLGQPAAPQALLGMGWAARLGQLAELGLTGLTLPEELGGAGLDHISAALTLEELARIDASVAALLAGSVFGCATLINVALKAKILSATQRGHAEELAAGARLGIWADAGMTVFADRYQDYWRLEGTIRNVPGAQFGGLLYLLADTEIGPAVFAVALETPGLSVEALESPLGLRDAGFGDITLQDVRLSHEACLLPASIALEYVPQLFTALRVARAAVATGLGHGAAQHALRYAGERKQFGKTLDQFQATQFKLADMATRLDAARLLTLEAAQLLDLGHPAERKALVAMQVAGQAALYACDEALQIHGGYGYTTEYPLERHLRDTRALVSLQGPASPIPSALGAELLSRRELAY